jgi:sorbitol-specific phosphotransferase system component IIC
VLNRLFEEFGEETVRSFVQKNADYYVSKWKLMAKTGSKISWNWAAFAFGVFWMGYRKMYLYSAIVLALSILDYLPVVGLLVALALWFGVAMLGNYLYGRYTYETLVQLKEEYPDEETFKLMVIKKGGTSIGGVVIVFIMAILFSLVGAALEVSMRGGRF